MNIINIFNRVDPKETQPYEFLSRAISHMDCTENLDQRTYFLTIKVVNKYALEKVQKLIFFRINEVLYGKRAGIGSRKASLIIGGDVEGSRENKPEFRNPLHPHFHALLILPHEDQLIWQYRQDELFEKLKSNIETIKEVKPSKDEDVASPKKQEFTEESRVWIKPFDPSKGSIPGTISYVEKAWWQAQVRNEEFEPTRVFPFEIQRTKRPKMKLLERKSDYYLQLLYDPRPFFSEKHELKLSDEHLSVIEAGNKLSGRELKQHIQRFVRGVEVGRIKL